MTHIQAVLAALAALFLPALTIGLTWLVTYANAWLIGGIVNAGLGVVGVNALTNADMANVVALFVAVELFVVLPLRVRSE